MCSFLPVYSSGRLKKSTRPPCSLLHCGFQMKHLPYTNRNQNFNEKVILMLIELKEWVKWFRSPKYQFIHQEISTCEGYCKLFCNSIVILLKCPGQWSPQMEGEYSPAAILLLSSIISGKWFEQLLSKILRFSFFVFPCLGNSRGSVQIFCNNLDKWESVQLYYILNPDSGKWFKYE